MESPDMNLAGEIASLAATLARGQLAAMGRMFDIAGPRLLRYALTVTRNMQDAEDAVQASMVRVARHPDKLAAALMPWAYCLRIVRNEALVIVQHKRPVASLEGQFDAWSGAGEAVEQRESADLIRAAIEKLPHEQAEVVALKLWEEMTFAEIAEVVGESHNTVASRYRYALQKLSRLLQPLVGEVHRG